MIVVKDIDVGRELTEEQKAMLEKAKNAPLVFDEDNPPLSDEQLKKFEKVGNKKRITMYVDNEVIEYYKKMSEECDIPYQTLINMCLKQSVKDAAHLDFIWNKPA